MPRLVQSVRGTGRRRNKGLFAWLCVTPYLILLLTFGIGPVGYAIYESFFGDPKGFGQGYATAVTDFRFSSAVANVGIFLAVYLPVMVGGVLILALVVDSQPRRVGRSVKLIYTLPGAITGSAAVLLWYFMLQPSLSPFKSELGALGLHNSDDVFNNSNLVWLFTLMAFATGFGQWILIIHGAMQNVPDDLIDAARVDGCNAAQIALRIKLPLIRSSVVYMLVMSFASGLQIFVEPQLLYGLTSAGSNWWSLNQLGINFAFANGDFASAAALSLLLFVVCLGVAMTLIVKGRLFDSELQ